jgi:hypothetical protein
MNVKLFSPDEVIWWGVELLGIGDIYICISLVCVSVWSRLQFVVMRAYDYDKEIVVFQGRSLFLNELALFFMYLNIEVFFYIHYFYFSCL